MRLVDRGELHHVEKDVIRKAEIIVVHLIHRGNTSGADAGSLADDGPILAVALPQAEALHTLRQAARKNESVLWYR